MSVPNLPLPVLVSPGVGLSKCSKKKKPNRMDEEMADCEKKSTVDNLLK
jgi:hypothetical protein